MFAKCKARIAEHDQGCGNIGMFFAQDRTLHIQCTAMIIFRLIVDRSCRVQAAKGIERKGDCRITGFTARVLNLRRSRQSLLCITMLTAFNVQSSEISERQCQLRIIRTERLLVDFCGLPISRFGFIGSSSSQHDLREATQRQRVQCGVISCMNFADR